MRGAVCQWHTPSADRAEGETLERSESKSPRPTQWGWVLLESQRKRPNALAASQRDNVAASSIFLASAFGESSLIALRLLSPQSQKAALRGPRLKSPERPREGALFLRFFKNL